MTSITRTLLLWILAGVLAVVLVSGAVVYSIASAALRAQFDAALADRARAMGLLVIDEGGELEFEYDHPPTEADFGVRVRLSDESGRAIAQSPDWPIAAPPPPPPPLGEIVCRSLDLDGASAARVAMLAMHPTAEDQPPAAGARPVTARLVRVEVVGRTDRVRHAQRAVLGSLLAGGAVALLGASGAVWLGIRRGLAPLRELGGALGAIEPDALRLPERSPPYPDELRPIVRSLSQMLSRLGAAMQRERRFTDAAAHELRTPIAELRTMTDVAERWPEPERLRRVVRESRAVIDEMEALLGSLLAVARGAPSEAGPSEPVALLAAVRREADAARPTAAPGPLAWTIEGDAHAAWVAPPAAVTAIVRNLVHNAAAYTPAGGSVRITVSASPEGSVLEVANGPVSLGPDDVEHIFEPFWRADGPGTDRRHRGLGLAIVDALAEAAGIAREAHLSEDGTVRVTLRQEAGTQGELA